MIRSSNRWSRRGLLGLLTGLPFSLAACRSQSDPQATPEPSPIPPEIVTSPSAPSDQIRLTGAGASFPVLLYQRWFQDYQQINPQVQVDYQAVGSAAGIQQFIDETVDFGASDVAMTDEEIAQVERGAVLLPMTAGSVVVAYNLPGVESGLQLSRFVLSQIFLGQITRWNDPQLVELNPDVSLPDLEIVVVHRSDGSGTTATFTRHLNAISGDWQAQVGVGLSVQWPAGFGAKSNAGVSAQVQQVEGVIAYVEEVYARELGLSVAALQNQAGNFVMPTQEAARAALMEVDFSESLRAFIPDPTGAEAYPIVTYSWILAYRSYADPQIATALQQVLTWALTEGQEISEAVGYLPLPEAVRQRAQTALDQIEG